MNRRARHVDMPRRPDADVRASRVRPGPQREDRFVVRFFVDAEERAWHEVWR